MSIDAVSDGMVAVLDAPEATAAWAVRPLIDRLILMRARCYDPRGLYNDLFHSDDPIDIARAKAICARCVVREPCLSRALERSEPCGVWGGQILHEGEVVAHRPRRGRRPKNPVSLIVDEVTGLECQPVVANAV